MRERPVAFLQQAVFDIYYMMMDVLVSWSGGKDAALALYHARRDPRYHVAHLLTSVTLPAARVAMHGVRLALLEAQAAPTTRLLLAFGTKTCCR